MIACQTCGNQSPAGSMACQYCGAALRGQSPGPQEWQPPSATQPTPARAVTPARWVEPRPAAYPPAYYRPAPPQPKDPSTGLLLELIPGLFGFLGIGRLWAGDIGIGLALLFGYWVFWGFVWFSLTIMAIFTLGLAFCFIPLFWIGAPVISGLLLRDKLQRLQRGAMGFPPAR